MEDAVAKGRMAGKGNPFKRGEAHPLTTLTSADVLAMRAVATKDNRGYWRTRDLAAKYKINKNTVANILNRVSWSHI